VIGAGVGHQIDGDAAEIVAQTGVLAKRPWIGLRDVALFTLLYGCGLRISEALDLTGARAPASDTLIVTGKGDKAFSAGNDLKFQAQGGEMVWPPSGFGGLTNRFAMEKPVIAAVNGLALGGSMENAVVIGDNSILNNQLRFEDEFVRHKILDAVGDIYLLGHSLIGAFRGHKSGHKLNNLLLRELLQQQDAWEEVTFDARSEVPESYAASLEFAS
jgi:hypothetical protein